MSLVEVNENTYQKEISEGTAILYFTASWCGPCKMLKPVLEELSGEQKGLKIAKVDVDENQDLAGSFGIMSVPTLILFKNGERVSERYGFAPKELIADWIANG